MKSKTNTTNNDYGPSVFINLDNLVALKVEGTNLFLIGLEGKAIASVYFANKSSSSEESRKAVMELARSLAASRNRLSELPAGFALARVP